jgi:hypothetical protein
LYLVDSIENIGNPLASASVTTDAIIPSNPAR